MATVLLVALDQFREATLLAVLRFVLIKKRKVVVVKPFEELVPANRLERALTREARIIDAQQSRTVLTLRVLHTDEKAAATCTCPCTELRQISLISGRSF